MTSWAESKEKLVLKSFKRGMQQFQKMRCPDVLWMKATLFHSNSITTLYTDFLGNAKCVFDTHKTFLLKIP
jgi:hypothetical protein